MHATQHKARLIRIYGHVWKQVWEQITFKYSLGKFEEHRDLIDGLLRCEHSQKYYFHFFSSILHLAFWVSRFSFSKPRALLQSRRVLVTNQEKFTLKALVEIGNCHCYIEILLLYNVFCFQDQPKERRREVTWLQALWILIDLCC